ncbi:hypothetical protein Dsin_022167, partial [Dipteronia sinensis]
HGSCRTRGMQGVALRIGGDKDMFYKIKVSGTQDTILDETGLHRAYLLKFSTEQPIAFDSEVNMVDNCALQSIATTSGAIAAHHRDLPNENMGFSFVNCVINGTGKIYLGRAWGNYSRKIYSYSHIDNIITHQDGVTGITLTDKCKINSSHRKPDDKTFP